MAIKVKVPNEHFNGIRGGVKFQNGIGVFEDEEYGRKLAKSFGYEVIEDEKPKKEAKKKSETKKATAKKRSTKKKDNE